MYRSVNMPRETVRVVRPICELALQAARQTSVASNLTGATPRYRGYFLGPYNS